MEYKRRSSKSAFLPWINCRQPVVLIRTDDEPRMKRVEYKALEAAKMAHIYSWRASTILMEESSGSKIAVPTLRQLLAWFIKEAPAEYKAATPNDLVDVTKFAPLRSALIVYDSAFYVQPDSEGRHSNPVLTREIIDGLELLRKQQKYIFLIGNASSSKVVPELISLVPSIDYPLPDINFLFNTVVSMRQSFCSDDDIKAGKDTGPDMTEREVESVAKILLGVNNCQAERLLTQAVVENRWKRNANPGHPVEFDRDFLVEQKRILSGEHQAIKVLMPKPRKAGEKFGLERVGGADALKAWLAEQKTFMTPEAAADGIKPPRGTFLYGVGGTGKDFIVEAAGQEMDLPVLYADMAANKGPFQGVSHGNFRAMLAFAEINAPCILALSEFEKMMAGAMATASAVCDGGTGNEIFATWLNWMQTRTAQVFVMGLANSLDNVTQPALRAGRFDRIWFIDVPDAAARAEIVKNRLEDRGYGCENINLEQLAVKLEGYTGAEIDAVVEEAVKFKYLRHGSRASGVVVEQGHLEAVIKLVHSTGKTRPGEVAMMRQFARDGGHNFANEKVVLESDAGIVDDLTRAIKKTPVKVR